MLPPIKPSLRVDIIKRGNRPSEEFNPEKLHNSITMTCLSLRTPEGQAEEIARAVTIGVMKWCETKTKITSQDIRRQASKLLEKLHTDAAFLYKHHKTII